MVLHVNLKAYRALYSQFLKLGAQCRVFIQIHLNKVLISNFFILLFFWYFALHSDYVFVFYMLWPCNLYFIFLFIVFQITMSCIQLASYMAAIHIAKKILDCSKFPKCTMKNSLGWLNIENLFRGCQNHTLQYVHYISMTKTILFMNQWPIVYKINFFINIYEPIVFCGV